MPGFGRKKSTLGHSFFLVRTHVKVERTASGKWHFLIEHRPAASPLLVALLAKLAQLVGRSLA